jgi:peptidoglycan/LPS O-acetylase OafA/YrhL
VEILCSIHLRANRRLQIEHSSNTDITTPAQVSGFYLPYLDGVRALAALYVMIHHAWAEIWPIYSDRRPTGLTLWLTHWMYFGGFGVDVFLVLSGFCLALPVALGRAGLPGTWGDFFRRRARRILPPYYAALIFSLVLIRFFIGRPTGTHWDTCLPVTAGGILAHVLLIQNFVGVQINHVFWSIATEWQIYLLFPLLVSGFRKKGPLFTIMLVASIVFLLVLAIARLPVSPLLTRYFSRLIELALLFAFGMMGAMVSFDVGPLWARWRASLPWGLATTAGAALIIGLCTTASEKETASHMIFLEPIVGLTTMEMLIYISRAGPNWLRAGLSARPLVRIGVISYSLYLIHAPLLQVVWQYAVHPLALNITEEFTVLFVLGGTGSLACAFLFFRLFEYPFLKVRRRELGLARQAAPSISVSVHG